MKLFRYLSFAAMAVAMFCVSGTYAVASVPDNVFCADNVNHPDLDTTDSGLDVQRVDLPQVAALSVNPQAVTQVKMKKSDSPRIYSETPQLEHPSALPASNLKNCEPKHDVIHKKRQASDTASA